MKIHNLIEAAQDTLIRRPTTKDLLPEEKWEKIGQNINPEFDLYSEKLGVFHSLFAVIGDKPVAKWTYLYSEGRSPIRVDIGCQVVSSKGIYASQPGYMFHLFKFMLDNHIAILGDTAQSKDAIGFYKKLARFYPVAAYTQSKIYPLDLETFTFERNGKKYGLWDKGPDNSLVQILVAPKNIDLNV